MDQLIEPNELSEEIIAKITNDYIKRYSLKQTVSPTQFHSDTNRLIAELELYSRTIRQLKSLASGCSTSLQEKMYESMLKVIQFLARYVQRLEMRGSKTSESTPIGETICEGCSSNLNAKKIQTMRRQIFEYLPVFGKEQLQQRQQNRYSEQQSVYLLGNDQTIKRMGQLQRNLQEKQLGLMRCIDQFQDFRANLLVGMPKHSMDRGLQDRFNTKDYVFKLAMHFSNSLKNIQDKINHLKAICKKTEDRSVQCNFKDHSQEQQLKNTITQQKASIVRAEAQIKKLNDTRNRLQEHAKIYLVQIKVLNNKLEQIEEENQTLKQQIFVQKLKNKGKSTEEKRQQLQVQEQKKIRDHQTSSRPSASFVDDISIANEVLSQLNKRKSQIEQSGVKMEEALPYLKNTFKKALDHFISQRVSSTIDRKRLYYLDPEEAQNSVTKVNKKQRKPSKALLNLESKKKDIIKVESNHSRMNPRNFLKIFHNEVNYKINGVKRHNNRNLSYTDDKNSVMGESQKQSSRFLYKHSTLQTEGNLKKRGIHVKLSSLSSEVKDSAGYESRSQLEIQYGIYHPEYAQSLSYNARDNQDIGLNLGQNQLNQLVEMAQKTKLSKHKGHLKRRKNESMTTFAKLDTVRQKMDNLIKIKKMAHKTLSPEALLNFFEPKFDSASSSPKISDKQTSKDTNIEIHGVSTSRQQRQGPPKSKNKIEEDRHAKMKLIFNKLNSLSKNDSGGHQDEEKDHLRRNHKKETMNLEQLSYLTAFFTLMAQAHLSNQALYSQLKISAFQSSKQNNLSSTMHQQAMMRDSIRQIILKHRKCARSKSLCRHLTEFLLQFNQCLNN